ncbi:hypothetical protein PF001_g11377 [Phytophthora fragariae]|uniref:Uncharacterized protein n=1 Tax=Phytophthora fragariae TaxID=53985 RepID=A0A6A3EW54_9STRA|nr:hypothetical protein PF009_g13216 [Phytophthora fragariae]KAE9007982.1 hypothetical protein PF011_g10889 [Phytophthora fragariae]KAE9143964.1 hypothetical protein PF006_g11052 [Phytophthora fragariae]KAE9307965.1 hypothetical protein PF001_g11377 [Phytophthora fragariae]
MIKVTLLIPGMPAMLWATKCTGDAVKTGEFIANFVDLVIVDIDT